MPMVKIMLRILQMLSLKKMTGIFKYFHETEFRVGLESMTQVNLSIQNTEPSRELAMIKRVITAGQKRENKMKRKTIEFNFWMFLAACGAIACIQTSLSTKV